MDSQNRIRPRSVMPSGNVVVLCITVMAFALLIWPGVTRYEQMQMGSGTVPVRINRLTGETQILLGASWIRADAAAPVETPKASAKAPERVNPFEDLIPASPSGPTAATDYEMLAAEAATFRNRLRDAIPAQEAYFLEKNTYAADVALLALPLPVSSQPRLVIRKADAKGWNASVSSPSHKLWCTIFVGEPSIYAIGPAKAETAPACGER